MVGQAFLHDSDLYNLQSAVRSIRILTFLREINTQFPRDLGVST